MLKLSNVSSHYSEVSFAVANQFMNWKVLEILTSKPTLAVATTLLVHHIALSCVSIVLHREWTHKSVELDPKIRKIWEVVVTAATTINPKEWIAAHTHHHRVSDELWNEHSEELWDPHSPRKYWKPNIKSAVLQLTNLDKLWEMLDNVKRKIDWKEPNPKSGYFDAINIIRETTRRESWETHQSVHPLKNPIKFIKAWAKTGWEDIKNLPKTRVRLEWRKPFMLERLIPGAGLAWIYAVSFGPGTATLMIVWQKH